MALIVTKEEVLKEILERPNERIHFILEEEINACHITFCNSEKEITFYGLVERKTGLELLWYFFEEKKEVALEPHIDTIKVAKENIPLAYVRYRNKDKSVVQERECLVEQFLLELLEVMSCQKGGLVVQQEEKEIIFEGDSSSFKVLDQEEQLSIKYLIKEFIKRNTAAHIREETNGYQIGNVLFGKRGLGTKKDGQNGSPWLSKYVEEKNKSLIWQLYHQIDAQKRDLTKKW